MKAMASTDVVLGGLFIVNFKHFRYFNMFSVVKLCVYPTHKTFVSKISSYHVFTGWFCTFTMLKFNTCQTYWKRANLFPVENFATTKIIFSRNLISSEMTSKKPSDSCKWRFWARSLAIALKYKLSVQDAEPKTLKMRQESFSIPVFSSVHRSPSFNSHPL